MADANQPAGRDPPAEIRDSGALKVNFTQVKLSFSVP